MDTRRNVLMTALMTLATTLPAVDFSSLKTRNPQPTPNHFQSVRFLNGTWFAAGEFGALASRTASGNWTALDSTYTRTISSIAFGNGIYVAAGVDTQNVLNSTDGTSWSHSSPDGFPYNNYGLTFANGKFWSAGRTDGVGCSTDGIAWASLSVTNSSQIYGIAFGAGRYVAVGTVSSASGQDGYIATSTDGTNWTTVLQGLPGKTGLDDDFQMVRFVNNQFLAGGKQGLLMASTDGVEWTNLIDVGVSDWFFDAAYFNGTYYLPGRQGKVHYSTDLEVWHQSDTGFNGDLHSVDTDGTRLIVVGMNGAIASSLNGLDWTPEIQNNNITFSGVTFGVGIYAAASADGEVWTSPDAVTWTEAYSDPNRPFTGMHALSDRLIAVSYLAEALVSTNGATWNPHTISAGGSINTSRLLQNKLWAVGADGLVASSANGADWATTTTGTEILNDIAFGKNLYVAVGDQGTILTSPDGSGWTPRPIGVTSRLLSVVYGDGRFIALTSTFGEAWQSADGLTWTNTGFTSSPYAVSRLFFEDNTFIAFPAYQGPAVSVDGLTWTQMNPFTSASLLGMVLNNDRVVVVGTFGLIMSNDDTGGAFLTLTPLGGGQAELSWTGVGFTLKTSTDPAIGWSTAPSQSNPQTIQLNDPKRFFRLSSD